MKLSYTAYEDFWDNPERYRLVHQKNWIPLHTPFSLQRGIAMHLALQVMGAGGTEEETLDMLIGARPRPDGRTEALSDLRALEEGVSMAKALLPLPEAFGRELYFNFTGVGPAGSHLKHSGHGFIDFLRADEVIVEFKSVNPKSSYTKKLTEWDSNIQADFLLCGARSLGIKHPRMIVQYVQEPSKRGEPWKVWEPLPVIRSDRQLELLDAAIYGTCETIEQLLRDPGIDYPWPHRRTWKCGENCAFSSLCGTCFSDTPVPDPPSGFTQRIDYLKTVDPSKLNRLEVRS